jgi:hypothetical protein
MSLDPPEQHEGTPAASAASAPPAPHGEFMERDGAAAPADQGLGAPSEHVAHAGPDEQTGHDDPVTGVGAGAGAVGGADAEPPEGRTIPRRYVALGLVVVSVVLIVALIVARNVSQSSESASVETITPASGNMLSVLAHVPPDTSADIGVSSPSDPTIPPSATGNSSLWQSAGGEAGPRPVVFFYGAEFAPYAAAERWPVVVALSRFGTFSQLGLMQSSTSTAFPNISTFTFWHVQYSSVWIDLQAIERYSALDPSGGGYQTLDRPTARQAASVSVYDTSEDAFPLLDVANHYVLAGSSFSPSLLVNLSQAQITGDLAFPDSEVAQAVLSSANEITAAICTVTGQRPVAVCNAHGVLAADDKMGIHPAG